MTIERGDTRTREQIISECDLLRSYIDPFIENDHGLWRNMFNKVLKEKCGEALQVLSHEDINEDVNSLYADLNTSALNPEIEEDDQISHLIILTFIGYEIGNRDEIELFTEDVIKPLFYVGILEDCPEARECAIRAMECGVTWKDKVRNELPGVINDALEKLNLNGL